MDADPALVETLRRLEEELLRPEVRRSRVAREARLAPDFVEIGASGRTWDRPTIVAALAAEEPAAVRAEGFAVRLLAADGAAPRSPAPCREPGPYPRSRPRTSSSQPGK